MPPRPELRLVTIGPSHYCEKARWGLDRSGVPYVEERHAPVTHMPALLRRHAGLTTPVLVTPQRSIRDSTRILHHLDEGLPAERRLYPGEPGARREVEALEAFLDERLGPEVRRWAYAWLLDEPDLLRRIVEPGVGGLERAAFGRFTALAAAIVRRRFAIDDATRAAARAAIAAAFAQLDPLLDDGRAHLVGERFSAADLTLAALAGIAVMAPEYGGGWPVPEPRDLPAGMAADVEAFRATPTGAFALRMYAEHRGATSRAGAPAPVSA